jgi:transposase
MDRTYEDERTRLRAGEVGFNPVVPPKRNRVRPWEYDMELYKRRNELERLFRRLKGFRGICTRSDKLEGFYLSVLYLYLFA